MFVRTKRAKFLIQWIPTLREKKVYTHVGVIMHKHQDYGRNGMVVLTVVIPRSVIFTSQRKKPYVALILIPGFHQNY